MKPRFWRRRTAFAAPRVTIRAPLPWTVRLLLVAVALGLAGAGALWTYDLGRSLAMRPAAEPKAAAAPVASSLPVATAAGPSTGDGGAEIAMLRAAQSELLSQVRKLETENARLKEDLEFFESVLPARSGSTGVAIQRFQAELVAPG
ncbi:MAG: DUF6776 family protein, partial [Burkholderiaceae bacterium]